MIYVLIIGFFAGDLEVGEGVEKGAEMGGRLVEFAAMSWPRDTIGICEEEHVRVSRRTGECTHNGRPPDERILPRPRHSDLRFRSVTEGCSLYSGSHRSHLG